ncbi:MAG: hypothetical protein N2595_09170 [bacterium]|nr:hypothetical protein [bacterium]
MKMPSIPLSNPWSLSFTHPITGVRHTIPATVPGNVELDLQRAGFVADPYPPDTPHALRDFEYVDDWCYETLFTPPPCPKDTRLELVFDGIDTIANVFLNDIHILSCQNMFIPHHADVTDVLKPNSNSLKVLIRSPLLYARRFTYPAGRISRPHRQPEAYLRKARHSWGWDNAPRLLSAGLWRPVYLRFLPPIRFSHVYFFTHRVTPHTVSFGARWWIVTPDSNLSSYHGLLRLSDADGILHEQSFDVDFITGRVFCTLPAHRVKLWWPRGYGDPHLYDLTLVLFKDQHAVAEWRDRVGIRELHFLYSDTTDPQGNGECCFLCNGHRIYVRGTNWKPLDAFHSRAATRTRLALQLCLDLHCNMVRVWGGGVYEDHDFFSFCDEHGLLVWQDFMFACEFPPQDQDFQRTIAHEAATIIQRLRNHPSLALWCGDNEVDDMFLWGNIIPPPLLPSSNAISRHVLKNAVATHDPYRSYVPSSPYVSDTIVTAQRFPSRQSHTLATPEKHLYPRDENYRNTYRSNPSHFIGETAPFFFCPMSTSPDIIARDLPRARRLWGLPFPPDQYVLDRHQDDADFLTWQDAARHRLHWFFAQPFSPDRPDELALALNIICADVYKFAIEWSRAHKWRKTGVLWWSLCDMWPMMFNYSIVDYHGAKKQPCYDWIKLAQQPLCLLIADDGLADLRLIAANDTFNELHGSFQILQVDSHNHETVLCSDSFSAAPNASTTLRSFPRPADQYLWLISWRTSHHSGCNHFVTGSVPFSFATYRQWVARISAALLSNCNCTPNSPQ